MNDRKGNIGSGCLTFLAGLVTGVSLTVVLLVIWALVRPVDRTPLVRQIEPGGLDLEVVLSEAFLNEAISAELAANQVEELGRIIVDTHRGRRLETTWEGDLDLGGLLPPSVKVDADLVLDAEDGWLIVYVERIGMGPVRIARESFPAFVQPLFESVEVTVEGALNSEIQAEGLEVRRVQTDEDSLTLGLSRP